MSDKLQRAECRLIVESNCQGVRLGFNGMESTAVWKGGGLFEHTPPSGMKYMTDARLPGSDKSCVDAPCSVSAILAASARLTFTWRYAGEEHHGAIHEES